ncbi:NAD-binding protein [Desulfovibrio sp.]|uniref:potassium channel family protein n=1 Tax=Desulfovibrio sp. TaxID=885 RepID=UPI0023CB045D|nr:NAD-binding protein [Desulfovibrio sp.]MDE7241708.1 NAD-binding protein [Desulfovibrio sp.]
MKFVPSQVSFFLKQHSVRRNLVALTRFMLMLVGLIILYSALFHVIMRCEGQYYSWITGLYWTLTVMTTLGFGDITFHSDLGMVFSIIVLLSGVILLLIMLPFAFIQFFYAPWLKAQEKGHTPRAVAADMKGHVIVVSTSPIALNLVDDLKNYGARCVLLCNDSQKTLDLLDRGYDAVVGEHDSATVYRNLRLAEAAMLVVLDSDVRNTNIVFTARDVAPDVPIVASAQSEDAIDILRLAGSTRVFQFHRLLGEALARRVLNANARFSIASRYKELVAAEGPVMRTPLVGKSLRKSGLRKASGANVVGLWERGRFVLPGPDTVLTATMVMVIVGDMQQIQAANAFLSEKDATEAAAAKSAGKSETAPADAAEKKNKPDETGVVILGCGRVGRDAARQLERSGRPYKVVDKAPKGGFLKDHLVIGDAADLEVLERAGIRTAPSVIITTHDDDTNIYLTLYCRRLREDIQIISRATLDRNVGILHAAGADLVLSLASMVTSSIINLLAPGKVLMISEGLNIFRASVGKSLAGKPLMGSGIRSLTHCSVVALRGADGILHANPDPSHVFVEGEEMYLIGDSEAEKTFYETFGKNEPLTA